jgi:hypothetical protein
MLSEGWCPLGGGGLYLGDLSANKITKKLQKMPSEKNVPKCSFAYLRNICFRGKEITA